MKLSNLQAYLVNNYNSSINRHQIFHTKRKRTKTFSRAIRALKAIGVRIGDNHSTNQLIIEDHLVRSWEPTPLYHKESSSIKIKIAAFLIASRSESKLNTIMEQTIQLKKNWRQMLSQIVVENIDSSPSLIIVSKSSDITHLSARVALEWVDQCQGSQNRIVWSIYTLNRTWPLTIVPSLTQNSFDVLRVLIVAVNRAKVRKSLASPQKTWLTTFKITTEGDSRQLGHRGTNTVKFECLADPEQSQRILSSHSNSGVDLLVREVDLSHQPYREQLKDQTLTEPVQPIIS